MGEAQLLWKACAEILRDQVSEGAWISSFTEAEPVALDDRGLVLAVPTAWAKERIEGRYLDLVRSALAEVGAPGIGLVIETRTGDTEVPSPSPDPLDRILGPVADPRTLGGQQRFDVGATIEVSERGHGLTAHERGLGIRPTDGSKWSDTINPKYTFEAFVTGSSNRFAQAAALAVAERPGLAYNPLFVYGDAGLGKTHLLQAVAHYVRENYPSYTVRYVSSETFLNEFVEAIRTGISDAFKRRYREVDVLLVDDVQFFEGKTETLEEFFHTFNTLYETNRQVVLSSDRAPDKIPTLEGRLRSRFKSGVTTDIQPPDLETRLAILRKKAERETTPIPDDVLVFIATHINDNIRELEGALIRVSAFTSLTKEPLTVELAERILGDILTERRPRPITPQVILEATSEMFGFPVDELTGKSRRRPLVTARQVAMYVFRDLTDLSYPAIAREFGGRDHTTVIHAVEKITNLIKEKRAIYDQVTELIQVIKAGG